jgi:hypothetical protein
MSQKNKLSFVWICLMAMVGSGCTKYLDYEGDDAPPRLVVNGLMQADSNFTVELSNSLGYIDGGNIRTLEDGRVAVFDAQGNFVDSLLHEGEGQYRSNAVAEANERYTVRATAGDFPEAFATDVVPGAVPIAGWDTLLSTTDEFGSEIETLTIYFDIDDPEGTDNFYLFDILSRQDYYLQANYDGQGNIVYYDTVYFDYQYENTLCFETSDQILISDNDVFLGETTFYSCKLLFSDRLFDGQSQRFSVRLDYFQPSVSLVLRLSSISEDYYRYSRSLQRYDYAEGDPFAEPVQVFTNLNGDALGIWGGSSTSERRIDF